MNADKTKNALHVNKDSPVWKACNDDHQVYDKFYADMIKDFAPYVADFLNDGIPTLIYAGDYEFICNYLGNRAWTLKLDWDHNTEFNAAKEKEWNNRAGLVRSTNGLTFLQVHDAGHMVPATNLRLRSP